MTCCAHKFKTRYFSHLRSIGPWKSRSKTIGSLTRCFTLMFQIWWFWLEWVTKYCASQTGEWQTHGHTRKDRQTRITTMSEGQIWSWVKNKANLRDLIAATGLVMLLKWDSNHRFFNLCDLEIWRMALKNNRACILYYDKLCASFQIIWWNPTGVSVRKLSIRVNLAFFVQCDLETDGWTRKQ